MKIEIILIFQIKLLFFVTKAKDNDDVFTDYCKPGLCDDSGGDGAHSGCKDGIRHDGKFQHPPCSEDASIIQLTRDDKQSILDYHNEQRNFVACGGLYRQYGLRPGCRIGLMTWDIELEKTAFLHVSYCLSDHDNCRSTLKYPYSGQNTALLPFSVRPEVTDYYITVIPYIWYIGYRNTKMNMIDSFYAQTEVMVNDFLISINERNNRIGCAFARFFDTKKKRLAVMLTCNYPVKNLNGSAVYNSCKTPASKCTKGTDPRYKFLCSWKEKYDVSGLLKHIPYDGSGKESYSCGDNIEFDHFDKKSAESIKLLHKLVYPNYPIPVEKTIEQATRMPDVTTTKKISVPVAKTDEGVFTDYCKPGLCTDTGGDSTHSGCKDGVPHDGNFQSPPCPEDAALIPLTDEEKQSILDYHNEHRNFVACGGLYKEYRLEPGCRQGVVTWDKELEKTAFLHTSYCLLDHDKCRGTVKYPFSGQNIGLVTFDNRPHNTSYYINTITYFWYVEYMHTKMDMINSFNNQADWIVDHFLISINERNNRVGCTFAKFFDDKTEKKDVVMLTCNYPTTNIEGTAIYNSCKKPASKCTTGTDPKYKYLCSSKESYDVSGSLKHIPYDGDGTEVFDCGKEPEFYHYDKEGAEDIKKLHKTKYPDKPFPGETPAAKSDEDVFTDYCKPGLCTDTGADITHSGCKDGVPHDGNFQSPPCPEDAALIPLTDKEKQSILDYHNQHRNFVACGGLYKQYRLEPGCRHGVVTWDAELEKTAFLHTSYCLLDHDKCRGTVKYPFSGQNVGLLTFDNRPHNTSYYINTITYFWYVEYMHTKMDMINSFHNQTKWIVDHFLTSINERNNRVGCTFAKFFDDKTEKKDVVMLTCNYPTTNIEGTAIYNSCKKPASKCTTGTDPKYKYLCSSKEPYDVSGSLKHIPYDGDGTEVFDCGKEPEFYHYDKEGAEDIEKLHKTKYPDKPFPGETPAAKSDEDVFTDYCKPGLCTDTGADITHSGCKDGVPHDGNFQSPPCPEDAALIPLTDEEKQSILDYHNQHRNFVACGGLYKQYRLEPGCRHGVVTWDAELEKTAFLHTSYCLLDHDKCRGTVKYPFSGQNVGLLTFDNRPHNTSYYINTITYFWYVEYMHTKMDMINSFHNQTKWIVDHFLTSINEGNNRVGCTFAKFFDDKTEKKDVVMLTCNYPTTNIEGTAIYNSCKKPASKCTTGTDPKYKYLCSSKEPYDVSGSLKHIPYDGDGTEVFDCGKEPEFYHYDKEGAEDIKKLHKTKYPDKPFPGETPAAKSDEDVFTDYCKPGLCTDTGADITHSGCKDGVPHDGNFQSPPCPEDAALIPLTDEEKQSILDYHNQHRNFVACGGLYKQYRLEPGCRHGVVTWDAELEKTAFLHTSYCLLDHDKCRGTVKYPFSGQNVGLLTFDNRPHNTSYYINTITYFWYVEYMHTKMDMINSFHNQTKWIVDHFLTSINEGNNRVGCTFAKFFDDKTEKKDVVMLTCNYPTTNIEGTAIYNSCKKPASKCTTGTDPKYKYLCSSKEPYDVSGSLKHIPYDGDGTEVFDCGKEPEFYHYDKEGAEDIKKLHKTKYPDKPFPGETPAAKSDEDVFTDYCKPGLCTDTGADITHSGCKDGVPHDGNFQSPPCPEDAALIPLTDEEKQSILDYHNQHRNFVACGGLYKQYRLEPGCRHGVVTWDAELEKTAFLHTSYCLLDHDKCRGTVKYPFSGQNVGLLTFDNRPHNTSYYINTITYFWYVEYMHTKMDMINSFHNQTKWIVDHFLTSINEGNNRVGCTFAKFFDDKTEKKDVVMLTCNYPTTNIEGTAIYNSCKKPASKCTTGTDPKYKYLCSSKEPYDVSGSLKHIPYDGDGTEVFDCGKEPEFYHYDKEGAEDIKKLHKTKYPDKPFPGETPAAKSDEDVFTDYCKLGLCTDTGADITHSGCKDGVPHDGNFQSPPCPEDAALIPLTDEEKQSILDYHNQHRNFVACGGLYKQYRLEPGCRHGVVTWDAELEKTAFLHTSYCLLDHDKCRGTVKYPFSGQNVGLLTFDNRPHNTSYYINTITYFWYVEYMHTKMDMINSFHNQTKWIVDHFLTSINEGNNRVGCTFAKFFDDKTEKKDVVMLTCNYPTTNIEGTAIYNSCKKPASKCTTGTDPKYKYLCSSKEPYDVSGSLKHIPYDGDGTEVFDCGKEPEFYHYDKEGAEDIKKLHKTKYPDKPFPGETPAAKSDEDVFTDYCKLGLCTDTGADITHSGCKDGVPHDGNFQSPPCPEDAALIPLTDEEKQSILDYHNQHRNFVACGGLYKQYRLEPGCRHGVVTWDAELEKTAFLHTSYCLLDHDKCRGTVKYPFSGQNVGLLTFDNRPHNTSYYINTITYFWYVEYMHTKMDMINSFHNQTKWIVDHFLTSINERNNRVGCTFAKFFDDKTEKKDVVMLTCNYPTTNIEGTAIYNSCKKPASKCTTGTDPKYKYLCSSKEPYDVSGSLKHIPYDGDGTEVFDCGKEPEFYHYDKEGAEDIKKLHKTKYPDKPFPGETPAAKSDEDVFTDYCKLGLCTDTGADITHSGCKDGVPHDGNFQSPPCPEDAALIPLTDEEKQSILDYHNQHRNFVACGGLYKQYRLEPGCRHGVVTWDAELEKTAFLHTSYCLLDHDKCRGTVKYPFSGQNVGLLTFDNRPHNTSYYINTITYFWYVEYMHTKMDMINSFHNQTKWIVDHFLTSINERNNRVGCTFAKFFDDKTEKKDVVMLTCNYPTTNIEGTAIYNSCKKPALKCTTGTDPKYKYLCSSKEPYDVSGSLKHIPYDGDGTEVFDCGKEPEFYHYDKEGAEDIKKLHKTKYPDKPFPGETPAAKSDEDVFTDYCKLGLCTDTGADITHSGCKDGVPHDGNFQSPPCPEDAALIPLTDEEKQSILDYHNQHRNFVACGGLYKQYRLEPGCRHGVVTWDAELEKTAFLHTSYCLLDHDKCRGTVKYPFSGQNVGLLTFDNRPHNTSYYINTITYFWYVEYMHTKMDMINSFHNQTKWIVDHFLTSINERNNRVGCTFAKFFDDKTEKKDVVMLTCNYPTTNIEGTAIYNSCKKPASKCTTGTDPKYKYLCSSKEPYDVSGSLKHIPYDGDGTEVFDCGKEPEFYHYDKEGAEDIKKLHKTKYPDKPFPGETPAAKSDEDVFTDYCKLGLCTDTGADITHSGCKDGVPHDGNFQSPPCPEDAALIPLTDKEKQSILDYHNQHRNFVACGGLYKQYRLEPGCRHGVVTWDAELEKTAFLHTSYCLLDHDKCRGTVKYPFSGQNVGLLTFDNRPHNTSYYINTITYFWYVEYMHTKMDMINSFHNQTKWIVDHFLTSINERNNRVGCTFAKFFDDKTEKKDVVMLTCNYPTTNIEGTAIYNSCKKPASKCTTGTDPKYKYLCSSKEPYDVSGSLKHIPYDGDGTEVFDCGKEPEFYHYDKEGAEDIKKLHKTKYPDKPFPGETPAAKSDEDVFTDYCKPGLCTDTGADITHSGCKDGVPHDGNFQSPPCPEDAALIPLTDEEKQSILDYHNQHRNFVACGGLYKQYRLEPGCRHGVVTWDAELEKTAFLHTSYCLLDHDKCRGTVKYPFSGQNVGLLTFDNRPHNTSYYINTITYFWYVEYMHTKMDMINSFHNQTKWIVDHFLTSINERNNRVGCTFAKFFDDKTEKKDVVMLTCNYPTTNIEGTAIYNSCKKPASKCTTGTDPKYKYLCSSKEPYDVSGSLKHIPYDGDGTEVFDCGKEPEFYHYDKEGAEDIKKLHKTKYPDKPFPGETPAAKSDEDVFTDYCKPGLCTDTGGDITHSGCKDGVPHDGNFQSPPCPEDAALIPLTDEEKQSILDYHNQHRNFVACGGLYKQYRLEPGCRHGVVTWDTELEKTAFLHTSYCLLDHDKCRGTVKYPFSGQNVGLLTFDNRPHNTSYYINTITYFWYVEYMHTKMDMINSFHNQTKWIVDHFLTSINERNNRVGCTFAKFFDDKTEKKDVVMLTCNYPTTNIEGTAIYNSCKKPASKCTTGTDPKYKYLCSSKEPYDVSGSLKHIPYDGDGTEVFDCGKEPEFYHYDKEGAEDIKKLQKFRYPDKPFPGETPSAQVDENIFTDYCKSGLCNFTGGYSEHSGCIDNVPHNGNFQHPPCPEDAARIPLTDLERQHFLDFFNEQRNFVACGGLYKNLHLGPGCRLGVMTWDKELEKTAFLHTSYCLVDHDMCRSTMKYPFSGQNIGLLTFEDKPYNTSYYINVMTYFWYVEYLYTNMEMIDSYFHQTKWMIGHFLTSINERNNRVGCSFGRYFDYKKQQNVVLLSCNYPTSNIDGTTIYNSCKKPASQCITGTDPKYKYLCSSKEPYDVSGVLKHIPYDGNGTEVFDCGKEPEFYHYDREGAEDIKKLHKTKYPDKPIPIEKPKEQTTSKPPVITTKKPAAKTEPDNLTDYCKPGLCNYTGGDNAHSGCKDGVPHNGKFQFPPCPENAVLIPLTDADKQSILDYHNEHRNFVACGGLYKGHRIEPGCRHGVVTWDKELEKTAFLHTSYCLNEPDKCHNTVKYPFSGQNIGVLPFDSEPRNTSYYINAITYHWYFEHLHTNMNMINSFMRQTTWIVDHFLILINERNNRVGCSFGRFFDSKKLRNVVMLTCNYPMTNIEGSTIYNSCKEPASKCITGTDPKFTFLCSSKEQYDYRSDLLRHVPYDGDGSEEFNCDKKAEIYEYNREGDEDIKKVYKPVFIVKPEEQTIEKVAVTTTKKPLARTEENIFTDYCKPGLCNYTGGDNAHSGCKNGVLHNGNLQSPPCPVNAATIPLTDAEKQSILDYHNEHRNFVACGGLYKEYRIEPGCRHGVVTWDKELEKTAFLHTSYCSYNPDKCRNTVKYPFSGQNVGVVGFVSEPLNTSYYINAITYFWYVEYLHTTMDMITVFKQQRTWIVDNFLILINERNNRVGCSFGKFFDDKKMRNVVMLTCNYPITNIEGSTIYNSCKKPASKCITGTDHKFKFLCSSREQYDHRYDLLRHIPYDGDGTEEFNCGRKGELYHYDREGAEDIRKLYKLEHLDKPVSREKPKEQTAKKVAVTTTKKPKEQTTKASSVTTKVESSAKTEKDFFTDYCKPGLCNYTGGDNAHSGCKDGVPHNGKFQFPPCTEDAVVIPLTDADKQSILDYHNEHRNFVACGGLYKGYRIEPGCRHGVVTWDKELEKTAFLHTSYCLYDPDKCRNTVKYPFSGQNIGVLPFDSEPRNTSYYLNAITYFWYVEYLHTSMNLINTFMRQTTWMVDHFLILINERNNRVGCSFGRFFDVKKLQNVVMLSCNYPTTNIEGSTIYNSCKKPASKCTTGTDSKFKFLCSSKEQYDHRSDLLQYIPYDGNGTEVFSCGEMVELYHYDREGAKDIKKLHKFMYPSKPVTTYEKPSARTEEDIFTNYCKPGLCNYTGGDNAHSGCKGGVPHNGRFQSPPCPENAALIPLTDADKQSILDYHNELRNFIACGGLYKGYRIEPGCRHGVVTWDKELEKTAFLHTSYCLYDPDKCRNTVKYPFSGQNVDVVGFVSEPRNTSYYINVITYFWYVEYLRATMDMITIFKQQITWSVDHFLILINERNNRVGCSFGRFFDDRKMQNVVMLTCNYPLTNIEGSTIYNSCKKPASKCITGTDHKFKFLCSSREQYDYRNDLLRHIPYDGDGTEEYDCGKKAELYHYDREGAEDIKKLHKIKYPDKPIPGEKLNKLTTEKVAIATTKKPKQQTTKKIHVTTTTKPAVSIGRTEEDIFTDYCKPGLCSDNMHLGCKEGVLHNGNFQSPPCPENAALIPLTDADKQSILDYHNTQRNFVACGGLYKGYRIGPGCRHGVVTWDRELEKTAFLHTSYCLYAEDKCHNTVKYPFSGQNVGVVGFVSEPLNTSYYINAITYFWYVEYLHTTMDMITVFKRQTTWIVDNFLILINERNNRVGCSFGKFFDDKKMRNVVMLTCTYPTTNIEGSTIYNSCKKPASKCITGTDHKFKFLCSSREQYDYRNDLLRHIPYDGDGTEEYNCGKKAEFYHYDREGAEDIKKLHKIKYPDKPIPRKEPKEKTTKKVAFTTAIKSSVRTKKDIFTDYCKPGLCNYTGGDNAHSGCKDGVLHDGNFQSPPCPENAALIPLTDADKQSILDYHNTQRNFVACGGLYKEYRLGPGCRHGAVTWDRELEKTAFLHTSYCLYNDEKCHNTVKYPFSGQNVGLVGFVSEPRNTSYYINTVTYFWYVEYLRAKMDIITVFKRQTKWIIDHFLILINERNNRVGCSFGKFFDHKKMRNVVMLTCNYPITNIEGSTIYNSCKKPASKCITGKDPKFKFLCSSREQYNYRSDLLRHVPYDGDGTEEYSCGKKAEFYHYRREGAEDIKKLHKIKYSNSVLPEEKPKVKTVDRLRYFKRSSEEYIFTDYCKSGLCAPFGGDGSHSGCKNGVLHDGKLQSPPCPEGAALIPLTYADKQSILDYHNMQRNFVACGGLYSKYRIGPGCRHGVVTWDKELEKTSFLHASNCLVDNDKCRSTVNYPFSGQNVGLVTMKSKPYNTSYYINSIIYHWYVEYVYATMGMIDSYNDKTKWSAGHFLTSINERNNRVGCSFVRFFDDKKKTNVAMLSCNYPTSNVDKTAVYNSCKRPASKCRTGRDPKYKFLCSSKEKYDVSAILKHISYDGSGTEVFNCGREAEFYHYAREGGEDIKQNNYAVHRDKIIPREVPAQINSRNGNPAGCGIPYNPESVLFLIIIYLFEIIF